MAMECFIISHSLISAHIILYAAITGEFFPLSLFLFVSIACRQLVNGIHSNAADNIEPLRRTKKYSEEGKRQSQRQSPRDEKFVRWQRRRQLYLRNFGDKIPCKFTTLLEFLKT